MDAYDLSNSNACPTIQGTSTLQQTVNQSIATYDIIVQNRFVEFQQDQQTGAYSLPSLDKFAKDNPPQGPVDMAGQKIINLSTIDVTSLEAILATP